MLDPTTNGILDHRVSLENDKERDRKPAVIGLASLRSVDIHPPSSMRVQHVQLASSLPQRPSLDARTRPTGTTIVATPPPSSSSSLSSSLSSFLAWSAPSSSRFVFIPWSLMVMMAITLLFEHLVVDAATNDAQFESFGTASAGSPSSSSSSSSSSPSRINTDSLLSELRPHTEWYIVLVSIPVLDKVLPLKNLAEELLARGYRVGFALPENCRHWVTDLENLEFISLGNILGKGKATFTDFDEHQKRGLHESYADTLRYYASFQRPMFGALIEDLEDDRPHLVVVDRYTFAGIDASHALSLPYVIHNPSLLMDIDAPPAYIPAPFSNFTLHGQTALERCLNGYFRLRFRLASIDVYKDINHVRRENGLPAIEHREQVYGKTLVLSDSAFGLDYPRPMLPLFQMVGYLQSRAVDFLPFPTKLDVWLNSELTYPVILIGINDNVELTAATVDSVATAIENLPVRFIWKLKEDQHLLIQQRVQNTHMNYLLIDEFPELLLLRHPQIRALLTTGNLHSIHEALCAGKPILGMPFSAEQHENINAVVRAGAGLSIPILSSSVIHSRLHRLLHIESFTQEAIRLGRIFAISGGVTKAADEIMAFAVVGHRISFFPTNTFQPWYKFLLVDVYLIYAFIVCATAIVFRALLSILLSCFPVEVTTSSSPSDAMLPPPTTDLHKKLVE